jgi:hypothetical protein
VGDETGNDRKNVAESRSRPSLPRRVAPLCRIPYPMAWPTHPAVPRCDVAPRRVETRASPSLAVLACQRSACSSGVSLGLLGRGAAFGVNLVNSPITRRSGEFPSSFPPLASYLILYASVLLITEKFPQCGRRDFGDAHWAAVSSWAQLPRCLGFCFSPSCAFAFASDLSSVQPGVSLRWCRGC